MHSVIDALLAVNVAEIPMGTTARLNCGGEGYYSTTTTTPPNRALFQRQFIVIPDTLFISEHPEDSHYSARRISEHLEVEKSGLSHYQFIELPLKASGWYGNQAFLVPIGH